MEFFETDVYLPIDQQVFEVTTETPRVPTAFEWAAVKIVNDFRALPAYSAASVVDVFRSALGGAGAETFMEKALNELFSSTANVLKSGEMDVSPSQLPISAIELTEDGERMLATGYLPSAPKRTTCKVAYDPIARCLLKGDVEAVQAPPEGTAVELPAEVPESLVELVRERESAHQQGGTRVGRVAPTGNPRRTWRRQRVGLVLEGGRVSIDRKAFGVSPEVADYLEALSSERARALLFSRHFDAANGTSEAIAALPNEGLARVMPMAVAQALPSSMVRMVVRGEGCALDRFSATALAIESHGEASHLELKDDVVRFTVQAGQPLVPAGAITDGTTMLSPQRIRCFYGELPLELPVVVERTLGDEERRRIRERLAMAIGELSAPEQCRVCFLMAENHQQRKGLVAEVVAKLNGEERLAVLRELVECLHASTGYVDMHAVIDGIFGQSGLPGFANVEEAQALAEALPLNDDERRWVKTALRPYLGGQRSVGESPENEMVWIEDPDGGRRHHGRKKHHRNHNKQQQRA